MNKQEQEIVDLLKATPEGLTAWAVRKSLKVSCSAVMTKMVNDGNLWRIGSGSGAGTRYIYLSEPPLVTRAVEVIPVKELEYGQAANNVMDNLARLIDENQDLRKCIQEIHDVTGRFLA